MPCSSPFWWKNDIVCGVYDLLTSKENRCDCIKVALFKLEWVYIFSLRKRIDVTALSSSYALRMYLRFGHLVTPCLLEQLHSLNVAI